MDLHFPVPSTERTHLGLKSLVFGPDADQALRIRRLLFASSTYFFCVLAVNYSIWQGLLPKLDYWQVIASALALNLMFYLAIRCNFNLGFRDPSLTIPQMAVATLVNTYFVYHAGDARGAFLMLYVLILIFGIFKLHPKQTMLIGTLVVLTYAALIVLESARGIPRERLAVEFLQLGILAFIYPWFVLLGAHLNQSRSNLRQANAKLAETLHNYELAMQKIQRQATHDDLTGVYNRRHIMEIMRTERERSRRADEPFSILLLDIDHFKNINDRHGHLAGDRVLVAMVRTVQSQLRAIDHLGRYGGEEFLIVIPAADSGAAHVAAERIRSAVEQAVFPEVDGPVTVSIGIAFHRENTSLEEMFSAADRALYLAKEHGRNRIESEPPRPIGIRMSSER